MEITKLLVWAQFTVAFITLTSVLSLQIGAAVRHRRWCFGLLITSSTVAVIYLALSAAPAFFPLNEEQRNWMRFFGFAIYLVYAFAGLSGTALLFRDYRNLAERLAAAQHRP